MISKCSSLRYTFRLIISCGLFLSLTLSALVYASDDFETGLWRLASRADLGTLSWNSSQLVGSDYSGDDHQHWRLINIGSNQFKFEHELTNQCLVNSSGVASLGNCSLSTAEWSLDTLRARTIERPALFHLRSGFNCVVPNGSNQAYIGACNDSARWYLEPVGFGERSKSAEYEIDALLLVKPVTDIPGVSDGILASSVVNAVQVAFEDRLEYWFDFMTDGRVTWNGTSVVSTSPITSLTIDGGNYLPTASDLASDVTTHIPRGVYDTVQVFFTPGNSLPGGWGWGPGSSYQSNYTLWTTVNGKNTVDTQWLSTTNSEPTEVFIHEPMHGFDSLYGDMGLPLPDGLLHGTAQNRYASSNISGRSWLHWYRDYWLGTVISSDDTYRGYGPRLFQMIRPKDYAVSSEVDEYKIFQATSGMCFSAGSESPPANAPLVLSNSCSDLASSFNRLSNGMIKHMSSGYCIHPYLGTANNNVNLILFPSCTPEARLIFTETSGGSLQNDETGRCVHPSGGSPNPSEGTNLIFHDGCDEARLEFSYVPQ